MSHLCVQKVIYSEWSSGRRDLGGTQFHQVKWPGGGGGEAMGLLMYSALTFMECNLKKHAFIQTETDGITHTHTFTQRGAAQKCENTQFSWHVCAHPHLIKDVHTPIPLSVM